MEITYTPLATIEQIRETPSQKDGIPADLEEDLRAYGAKLIQQAGLLLKQYAQTLRIEIYCSLIIAQETSGHVHGPGAVPTLLVYQLNGKIRDSGTHVSKQRVSSLNMLSRRLEWVLST